MGLNQPSNYPTTHIAQQLQAYPAQNIPQPSYGAQPTSNYPNQHITQPSYGVQPDQQSPNYPNQNAAQLPYGVQAPNLYMQSGVPNVNQLSQSFSGMGFDKQVSYRFISYFNQNRQIEVLH